MAETPSVARAKVLRSTLLPVDSSRTEQVASIRRNQESTLAEGFNGSIAGDAMLSLVCPREEQAMLMTMCVLLLAGVRELCSSVWATVSHATGERDTELGGSE